MSELDFPRRRAVRAAPAKTRGSLPAAPGWGSKVSATQSTSSEPDGPPLKPWPLAPNWGPRRGHDFTPRLSPHSPCGVRGESGECGSPAEHPAPTRHVINGSTCDQQWKPQETPRATFSAHLPGTFSVKRTLKEVPPTSFPTGLLPRSRQGNTARGGCPRSRPAWVSGCCRTFAPTLATGFILTILWRRENPSPWLPTVASSGPAPGRGTQRAGDLAELPAHGD